jgi:hypothetical protein
MRSRHCLIAYTVYTPLPPVDNETDEAIYKRHTSDVTDVASSAPANDTSCVTSDAEADDVVLAYGGTSDRVDPVNESANSTA